MRPVTFFRNAVTVTLTEEEARVLHAALELSPAATANQTRADLDDMLKKMKRFRRRYERHDPKPTSPNRELFPAWVS